MTKLREYQAEPFFISDGQPSNDLPIPPYRTTSLPQILAGLTDDELARWPDTLTDAERKRRYRSVG
jgi:hypothetical protein